MSSATAQKQDRAPDRLAAQQRAHEPSMEEILASIRRIIADDRGIARAPEAETEPVADQPASDWRDAPLFEDRQQADPAAEAAGEPALAAEQMDENTEVSADPQPETFAGPEPADYETSPVPSAYDEPVEPEHEPEHQSQASESMPEDAGWRLPDFSAPPVAAVAAPAVAPLTARPVIQPRPAPAPVHAPVAPAAEAYVPPAPQPAPSPAAVSDSLLSEHANAAVSQAFSHLTQTMMAQNARTLEDIVGDMLRPMLKSWLDDNLPVLVERLVRAEIERVARGGR